MSQDKEREDFERELRRQCFQKPTPEAYDLAWCMWKTRAALASQQAVKGEPCACWPGRMCDRVQQCRADLAPPPSREPLTEWEARGMLARLKCWHRLTEQEADELVQFAMQGGIHSRGEGEKA